MSERAKNMLTQLKVLKYLKRFSIEKKLMAQNLMLYIVFMWFITLIFNKMSMSTRKDTIMINRDFVPVVNQLQWQKDSFEANNETVLSLEDAIWKDNSIFTYDSEMENQWFAEDQVMKPQKTKSILFFKVITEKIRHKHMVPYVLIDENDLIKNQAENISALNAHLQTQNDMKNRLGLFSTMDNLYGYYILDTDKYSDPYGMKSLKFKIKRSLIHHWLPVIGFFGFFTEIMRSGLDETQDINMDANHELISAMVPYFDAAVHNLNDTEYYTSFIDSSSQMQNLDEPIGFLALFTNKLDCSLAVESSPSISVYNFLTTDNFLSDTPPSFNMSWFEYLIFKIKGMVKSFMVISLLIVLVHSLNMGHIYLKYSLFLLCIFLKISFIIKMTAFVIFICDDFSEILLVRHKGSINFRIESYVASFVFINYYCTYTMSMSILPILWYLTFLLKRAYEHLCNISVVYDQLINVSNTIEALSAVTNNNHADTLYYALNRL